MASTTIGATTSAGHELVAITGHAAQAVGDDAVADETDRGRFGHGSPTSIGCQPPCWGGTPPRPYTHGAGDDTGQPEGEQRPPQQLHAGALYGDAGRVTVPITASWEDAARRDDGWGVA